jgi:hypothetical protein
MGNKEDIPTIESVDVHRNFSRKKLLLFVTAFISVILLISLLLFMTRGTVKKTVVPGNNISTPLPSPPKRPNPLKKIPSDFKSGEILKRRPFLVHSDSDSGSESADSYFDSCPSVEIKKNKSKQANQSTRPTTSTDATSFKKHELDPKVLENRRSSLKPMIKPESETAKKPKPAIEAADELLKKSNILHQNRAVASKETLVSDSDSDSDSDSEKWK